MMADGVILSVKPPSL